MQPNILRARPWSGLGVSKLRKALEDVRPDGMVSRFSVFRYFGI